MDINIGIKESDRAKIAEGISRLLADTYTLYLAGLSPIRRDGHTLGASSKRMPLL